MESAKLRVKFLRRYDMASNAKECKLYVGQLNLLMQIYTCRLSIASLKIIPRRKTFVKISYTMIVVSSSCLTMIYSDIQSIYKCPVNT